MKSLPSTRTAHLRWKRHSATFPPHQTGRQRSWAVAAAAAAAAAPPQSSAILSGACTVHNAAIGVSDSGYRGLIATRPIHEGDVVVSVPLSNVLQVARSLKGSAAAAEAAKAAAAAALQRWQQRHGQLPQALTELVLDPDCPWEAKLVAWLLHLKSASLSSSSSSGSGSGLWGAYCQALPAAQDALTFFCFSPQQAEQLQFSTWKALAASQRQLLLEVQQQCSRCFSSSGWVPSEQDVAWALSMVKSRTFGRALQPAGAEPTQQQPTTGSHSTASPSRQSGELDPAAAEEGAAAGGGGADGDEESRVVLLMIPFVDMINHSPASNCEFGVNWAANSFEVTASCLIPAGREVTISYGSNKSNLALLSCYGFFTPGNLNDAQLLQPVFGSCLAAAGSIVGFQQDLLDEALLLLEQQQQGPAAQPAAGGDQEQSERAARRRCAVAALPVAAGSATAAQQPADAQPLKDQLQLQRYLAELVLYQVQQVLRLCGTTAEEDAAALQQQQQQQGLGMDAAILQLATAARLDQKLLLLECRAVCEQVLRVINGRLLSI